MLQLKYAFDIQKKSPSVFGTKLLNFSFSCFYFWFYRFLIIEKYLLSMSTNILFDPCFKLSVARRQNCKLFRLKKNVAEKDRFAIKIGMRSWTENCLDIVGWTKGEKKELAVSRMCCYANIHFSIYPYPFCSHSVCSLHRVLS